MRIYVAGPYTGDEERNVERAAFVGGMLALRGHTPFVPHLFHYVDEAIHACGYNKIPYEEWMRQDLEWLRQCEAVFRMAGRSPGADREVALAEELGLPVYHCLTEVPRI